MKTLLSVVVCSEQPSAHECDGIEFLYKDEGESDKDFLNRSLKAAKGKYTVITEKKFIMGDTSSILNIIDKNSADMVCFTGGSAIRTSHLKSVAKDCVDAFTCDILGILQCKSLLKTVYAPFLFSKSKVKFTSVNAEGVLTVSEEFVKVKRNLPKEIYSYAFNLICDKLVLFYVYSMLAIKDGDMPAEKLIEFDAKLKAEIVLYLALEKRFTASKLKLNKMRAKNFAISGLTARKFRKIIG